MQNGTVNVGYVRMSDQIVLSMFSAPTNCEKGMKRIVGGIRYVRKIAIPIAGSREAQPREAVGGGHGEEQRDQHDRSP